MMALKWTCPACGWVADGGVNAAWLNDLRNTHVLTCRRFADTYIDMSRLWALALWESVRRINEDSLAFSEMQRAKTTDEKGEMNCD